MKVAIMQPYVFPYIGYFQLIHAVDVFVFYDDVNFIKKGFINRNSILLDGKVHQFTIPCKAVSQNKLIKDITLVIDDAWIGRFLTTLEFNYKKAPYYTETMALIKHIFDVEHRTIADLAIKSIEDIADYLDIETQFKKSSAHYSETVGMGKSDRLIEICKQNKAKCYINPLGGKTLYDKTYFKENNLDLFFIEHTIIPYQQFKNPFVGSLSILDVLMFNTKTDVQDMLTKYSLV